MLSQIKSNITVFSFWVLVTGIIAFIPFGSQYNFGISCLFFGIGFLALYGVFLTIDQAKYSLNKTFCIFFYFFFGLAPIIQFKYKAAFYGTVPLSTDLYIFTGNLLLSILVIYIFGYHLFFKVLNQQIKIEPGFFNNNYSDLKTENSKLYFILSILGFLGYFYLIDFNWNLLIYRPFLYKLKENTNFGLVGYAFALIFQLIPFMVLLRFKLSKTSNLLLNIFLIAMVLLATFPTALSRALLAIIYIPLVILHVPILKKGMNYVHLFFIGLLIIFPIFNNFRYLNEQKYSFNYELFNSGHFDAFQNFALLLDSKIVTHGLQLLGSVFFFIQENQWKNRPVGSGQMLAEKLHYKYTNIAMPFFGEGYVNFGFIGVFIFLLVIIFINSLGDVLFLKGWTNNIFKKIFYVLLGFEFYLLRGDLYSSVKIIVSFVIALLIVDFSMTIFRKKNVQLMKKK
jgi:hypothetical protein